MGSLIHRFREHVTLRPGAIAVEDDSLVLTFQQLDQSSNVLAHEIRSRAQSGNIAIYIPRSALLLVSVLAVVKAGFAYVPLDPSAPLARLDDQVSQTDAQLLLVASGLVVDQPKPVLGRALTLDVVPIVTRECVGDDNQLVPPDVQVDNTALLAVLFTSGSTGRPKGVLIEHVSTISTCIQAPYTHVVLGQYDEPRGRTYPGDSTW
jgi:non-ribosomal peptide synthetase component F